MRGKAPHQMFHQFSHGITPAYAGKRRAGFQFQFNSQDHPRLCGEKWYNNRRGELYAGSPPPMRGKACKTGQGHAKRGITPAYAGKSDM